MPTIHLVPALSGSLDSVLAYFVLIFCIDIAVGVIRSMIALWKKEKAKSLNIKGFSWDYLLNFAKSQLTSPPMLAVFALVFTAPFASDASQPSLYALLATTLFAQSLVLTRDVFNKVRELAKLLT